MHNKSFQAPHGAAFHYPVEARDARLPAGRQTTHKKMPEFVSGIFIFKVLSFFY